jgi:two-component system chemotaxis response regulator CheB
MCLSLRNCNVDSKKIRILIVDDSVLFRSQIQLAFKDVPGIEIVGTASNGKIAIAKMRQQDIDVCILDIEMPELDGIATLKEMKTLGLKTKAIMFSTLTLAGAEKTLEAMKLGAVDFCPKPQPDQTNLSPASKILDSLLPKILSLFSGEDLAHRSAHPPKTPLPFKWNLFIPQVLVIASSTGGPNALTEFFGHLKEDLPFPILVTQHMPPLFTASLAERLGFHSGKVSREAVDGEILLPNRIYVAPGNYHMSIAGDWKRPRISLTQGPLRNFVRPCADFLFESAASIYGKGTLGIVFTGMGRDGAAGAAEIKKNCGAILIQSQESCVVFGMPGAVYDEGHFDFTGNPRELAQKTLTISRPKRGSYVA